MHWSTSVCVDPGCRYNPGLPSWEQVLKGSVQAGMPSSFKLFVVGTLKLFSSKEKNANRT